MKIAFVEIDTHAEIFSQIYRVSKISGVQMQFFVSEKIQKQSVIFAENITIISSENLFFELKKFSPELVILGTVHRNFGLFGKIVDEFKTAIIVHNKNFEYASKFQLIKSVLDKDKIYRTKILVKERLLSATIVFSKAKNRLVLDYYLSDDKHLFLPIFFVENEHSQNDTDELKIVIPGTVSSERRDYKSAFEKFRNYKSDKFSTLILAGKVDVEMLNFIKSEEKKLPKNKKLIYFTEKISSENFAEILGNADFLWAPLKPKTKFFGVKELYGFTKMSGTLGDSIRFSKPMIVPDWYPETEEFIIRENDFFENKKFTPNFENYSKEIVAEKFQNFITNIIK